MKLSDTNPHIRYARRHEKLNIAEQDSVCYDCRLFFVHKGAGQICIFGEKYNFSNNTVIFLPPKTQYRFYLNPNDEMSIYTLNFDLVNDYSHLEKSLTTATVSDFDESRVPQYETVAEFSSAALYTAPEAHEPFRRIAEEFLTAQPCYREISSGILKGLLMQLVRADFSRSDTGGGICGKVKQYIHENFRVCELSNEDIARHFGYHPYCFFHSQRKKHTKLSYGLPTACGKKLPRHHRP